MSEGIPIVAKIIIGAVIAGVLLIIILVPMSFSSLEYYQVSTEVLSSSSSSSSQNYRAGRRLSKRANLFTRPNIYQTLFNQL